jgi:hypothetical protein
MKEILTPKKAKKWFLSSKKYDPGCSSRIPDPDADFRPSRILDPGVKKAPNPGSGSATLGLNPDPCLGLSGSVIMCTDPDPFINKQKNKDKLCSLLFCILKAIAKKSSIGIRIRIRNPVYRSKYPDPYQNVADPEHRHGD